MLLRRSPPASWLRILGAGGKHATAVAVSSTPPPTTSPPHGLRVGGGGLLPLSTWGGLGGRGWGAEAWVGGVRGVRGLSGGKEGVHPLIRDAHALEERIKACSACGELLGVLEAHRGSLFPAHVSMGYLVLSKAYMRERDQGSGGGGAAAQATQVLSERVRELGTRNFNARDISLVYLALGRMRTRPDEGLQALLEERASALVHYFSPEGLSTLIWAHATLTMRIDPGLKGVLMDRARAIFTKDNKFDERVCGRMLYSLAVLGERDNLDVCRDLIYQLVEDDREALRRYSDDGLVSLLWSIAKLDCSIPDGLPEEIVRM